MKAEEKKVKPIVLKNNENGDVFTLEFNRESVKFAEMKGFSIESLDTAPMTFLPDLFYYSFRMHHRNLSRNQTDKILFEDLGGMSDGMIERLGQLYAKPFEDLIQNEDKAKNAKMSVEL